MASRIGSLLRLNTLSNVFPSIRSFWSLLSLRRRMSDASSSVRFRRTDDRNDQNDESKVSEHDREPIADAGNTIVQLA